MTVRRERVESFGASLETVRDAVTDVLRGGRWYYSYADTTWSEDGLSADTRIKPKWWTLLLSTRMRIVLQATEAGCTVSAQTESQSYVRGDVFGCYQRLLDDFFAALSSKFSW
jgi:hypothetical protein